MDARQQWAIVSGVMQTLPDPPYFLTSKSTPDGGRAGVVMQIDDRKQVAQLIVAGSHRISTPSEIESLGIAEAAAVKFYADIETKNKQQMAMPQEVQDLVRLALGGLQEKDKKDKR